MAQASKLQWKRIWPPCSHTLQIEILPINIQRLRTFVANDLRSLLFFSVRTLVTVSALRKSFSMATKKGYQLLPSRTWMIEDSPSSRSDEWMEQSISAPELPSGFSLRACIIENPSSSKFTQWMEHSISAEKTSQGFFSRTLIFGNPSILSSTKWMEQSISAE